MGLSLQEECPVTRSLAVFVHMVSTNTDSGWNAQAREDPGEIGEVELIGLGSSWDGSTQRVGDRTALGFATWVAPCCHRRRGNHLAQAFA